MTHWLHPTGAIQTKLKVSRNTVDRQREVHTPLQIEWSRRELPLPRYHTAVYQQRCVSAYHKLSTCTLAKPLIITVWEGAAATDAWAWSFAVFSSIESVLPSYCSPSMCSRRKSSSLSDTCSSCQDRYAACLLYDVIVRDNSHRIEGLLWW